jgi:NhaP-type Na+/H+ or K+/H+ antiporter
MSPARSKRQPVPHRRSRADIVRAIGVAAVIVVVTAILVWLLRPGPPGIPATGGLMNRQPRASWLIALGLGAAGVATWFILRGSPRTRKRAKVLLPVALGVVLVAVIVGGIVWPGGLLRHDVAPAPVPETTTTTTRPGASTTIGGSGGGSGATTPTTGPSTSGPAPTGTPTTQTITSPSR